MPETKTAAILAMRAWHPKSSFDTFEIVEEKMRAIGCAILEGDVKINFMKKKEKQPAITVNLKISAVLTGKYRACITGG